MHAYAMTAGSTARVEESSMLASATGVGGRSLQNPDVEEEEEISTWKKSMEFLFQSHCLAHISMKKLHHL